MKKFIIALAIAVATIAGTVAVTCSVFDSALVYAEPHDDKDTLASSLAFLKSKVATGLFKPSDFFYSKIHTLNHQPLERMKIGSGDNAIYVRLSETEQKNVSRLSGLLQPMDLYDETKFPPGKVDLQSGDLLLSYLSFQPDQAGVVVVKSFNPKTMGGDIVYFRPKTHEITEINGWNLSMEPAEKPVEKRWIRPGLYWFRPKAGWSEFNK